MENPFESPANTTCACPGEVLTFTCTVDGGIATIWGGSAFDCDGKNNEITLLHRNFVGGTMGECSDGAIVAHSLGVTGTCHTSQLNVTVSAGLNNKTVVCYLTSVMDLIGESLIRVAGNNSKFTMNS